MMIEKDPKLITLEFNHYINTRDIEGLSSLMIEDHTFIDSSDEIFAGKDHMVPGWREFFELYPDYRNHFAIMESRENQVFVSGHSTCSYMPLDGPAIWTAIIEDGLVAEWRAYLDNEENRKKLKLDYLP